MNSTKKPVKILCKICGTYTRYNNWCNNIEHELNYKLKMRKKVKK